MKCFINNRNYLTWPRTMAYILRDQGHEVVVVDNASTYRPLLAWLATAPRDGVHVVRMDSNEGPTAPWRTGLVPEREPYVVTDPDLDISAVPEDWPEVLQAGLAAWPEHSKIGLSLDETRVPSENPAWLLDGFDQHPNGHPVTWHNAEERAGRRWHRYPVDTTFALYRAGTKGHWIDGVRADRPYTARHLPWHVVLGTYDEDSLQIPMTREIAYYFAKASNASVSRERMLSMVRTYLNTVGASAGSDVSKTTQTGLDT